MCSRSAARSTGGGGRSTTRSTGVHDVHKIITVDRPVDRGRERSTGPVDRLQALALGWVRSTGAVMGRSTVPFDRAQPRAACFSRSTGPVDRSLPRSTGRSTVMILCTSCTPVDRAVDRPSPPVDQAVDREHNLAC